MFNDEPVCGLCKYHTFDILKGDWECVNAESEYFTDNTDYSDCCDEYEER